MADEQIIENAKNLQNRLKSKRREEPKVIPLISLRWIGYAVAASVVLAAGWWIFSLTRPDTSGISDVAVTEVAEGIKNPDTGMTDNTTISESPENGRKGSEIKSDPDKDVIKPQKENAEKQVPSSGEIATGVSPKKSEDLKPGTLQTELKDGKISDMLAIDTSHQSRKKAAAITRNVTTAGMSFSSIDTSETVPAVNWFRYKEFLETQLSGTVKNTPATLTIYVLPDGSVEKVDINSNLSESEVRSVERIFKAGPSWKNKSGKDAKAILGWQ